jgi:hypothetical protein
LSSVLRVSGLLFLSSCNVLSLKKKKKKTTHPPASPLTPREKGPPRGEHEKAQLRQNQTKQDHLPTCPPTQEPHRQPATHPPTTTSYRTRPSTHPRPKSPGPKHSRPPEKHKQSHKETKTNHPHTHTEAYRSRQNRPN